jgi:uncharacterized protein (DUF697 family)
MAAPPLPPYRARTPSGHDVPIPEAVFNAIAQVQAEHAGTRAEVAGLRADVADVKDAVQKIAAAASQRWVDMLKVIVPAVVTIVGGVVGANKLTAPAAPEPTKVYESALSVDLRACQRRAESEQRRCLDAAYEADRLRAVGVRP